VGFDCGPGEREQFAQQARAQATGSSDPFLIQPVHELNWVLITANQRAGRVNAVPFPRQNAQIAPRSHP
jgi:hypothetical protein